ncbi:MAG: nucleoside hydrolase [Planctomycetia bacterium]|nr:nucleoside hydrolase [Planctomycetia bacterium]
MKQLTRRTFIQSGFLGVGSTHFASLLEANSNENIKTSFSASSKNLVLHQTDLFHPHGDPDDHFDLATLFALVLQKTIDLRGIVLDFPPGHRKGDPDVLAIAQLNRLCGTFVPSAVGVSASMKTRTDSLSELSNSETTAVRLITQTLEEAKTPIRISCVGSATDIAVAALRNPDLFAKKCSGIYLDAGAAFDNPDHSEMLEFNVKLNPKAYAAMFDLPCPLFWFPCWNRVEIRESEEWGTFYWLEHRDSLKGISIGLSGFFEYMFSQTADPQWLKSILREPNQDVWELILQGKRGMWSTASLLYLADLTVTKGGDIVPVSEINPKDELYRMEFIDVECCDNGRTNWKISETPTNRQIFHLLDPKVYPDAMTKAIHSLFMTFV